MSSPKPEHTTGGSGRRGARRGSAAGPGRKGRRHVGWPRSKPSLQPARVSWTTVLNIPLQARTKEILCKPMEEQNPRLTRGSSAVYPRFISGTASALRSWLLTSVPTPICLCKPFSCKACLGTSNICRIRNPDIPRASLVGAHGGVAGRGRAGLDANRIVGLGNNLPRTLQSIEETSLERLSRSTNKRNHM